MKLMLAASSVLAVALSGCGNQGGAASSGTAESNNRDGTGEQKAKTSAQSEKHDPTYRKVKTNEDGTTVVAFLTTKKVPEIRTRTTATGDKETYTTYVEIQEEKTCIIPAGEDISEFVRQLQAQGTKKPQ